MRQGIRCPNSTSKHSAWSPENPTGNICIKQGDNQSRLKFVQATTNSSPYCCQRQSKENVTDCTSTHVKPNHTTATLWRQRKRQTGNKKKAFCVLLIIHDFCCSRNIQFTSPHWVFHPLCTAANLCPARLEAIQLTKTFQSGGVFLGVALLTGLSRRRGGKIKQVLFFKSFNFYLLFFFFLIFFMRESIRLICRQST